MKKKLSILVAALTTLVIACTLMGCSGEPSVKIALGGNLGNYEATGVCYGSNYKKIATPEELVAGGDTSSTTYYCANCDTPYIMVHRWDATGQTLEESLVASASHENAAGQISEMEKYGTFGHFNTGRYIGESYYYVSVVHFKDGNDAVEICFFAATEEVALGDTGLFAYVPKGYTVPSWCKNILGDAEDDIFTFVGDYADCYYVPSISIDPYQAPKSYEHLAKSWTDVFKEGTFPVTEEDWAKYTSTGSMWNEENILDFYHKIGYEVSYESGAQTICGATIYYDTLEAAERNELACAVYVVVDNQTVEVWFYDDPEHFSEYAPAFIGSIHTK